jgi:PAS domain S-box-containing protein
MKLKIRILMIEDSEADKELILLELRRGGYEPDYECVETSAAMRKALTERQWDIILSDYAMPHFDGLSALRILQTDGIDIPFIIISGTIGEDVAVTVMKAGAHDYIMKDNLRRLIPAIERELKEAEIRRRQKETEKDLLLSEENFKNVFHNSSIGISITMLDGRMQMNPAYCRILGYSPKELEKIKWQTITHPDDVEHNQSIVADIIAGKMNSARWEKRYFHKNGNIVWVDISSVLQRDEHNVPMYFITSINDITERKNLEERAIANERKLHSIINTAIDGFWILNVHGRILQVNQTYCTMSGYSEQELLQMNVSDLENVESQKQTALHIQRVLERGQDRFETVHIRKDGSVFDVRVSVKYRVNAGEFDAFIQDVTEQKKADAQIRENEMIFEQLLENSPVYIFFKDENIRPLKLSRNFEQMLKMPLHNILGKSMDELFPSELARNIVEDDKRILQNGELIKVDEEMNDRCYTTIKFPISIEGKPRYLAGFTIDITDRKKADLATQTLTNRLQIMLSALQYGVLVVDNENRIEFINNAFCEQFGLQPEPNKWIGLTAEEFIPLILPAYADPKKILARITAIVAENKSFVDDEVIMRNGDTYLVDFIPLVVNGINKGRMWLHRNITERKRKDAKIQQLSKAIEQTSASIVITDISGIIEYVNTAFTQTSGYSKEEVIGKKPSVLKSGHTTNDVYGNLWKTITAGKEWSGEFHNRKKDGSLYWESVIIAPVKNDEGTIINFIAVKDEITERKGLQSQLLRAQRLESIGTLAGGIAHDLNNILGPILLSIQVLRTKLNDASMQNLIDTIESASIRGKNIVAQVLAFARGSDSTPILIQVRHIVKEVEDVIKQTFPKDIDIQSYLPKDLWTINADPTQIHQILLNLCVNARDAMPHGGRLTVNVKNIVIDESLAQRYDDARSGRYLEIEVRDTGTGMPPDIQQKIFDPFFTTKAPGKGTGLGLSTVYTIVKHHHGFISMNSIVGEGTVFQIYIPASSEVATTTVPSLPESIPQGNKESILVVDDEVAIQQICEETLRFYNYDVITANNGAECISKFIQKGMKCTVVLMDMMMPVMGGKTAGAAIRKIDPNIRIVGMSGLMTETLDENDERIFDHFLRKPFTGKELMDALQKVIAQ